MIEFGNPFLFPLKLGSLHMLGMRAKLLMLTDTRGVSELRILHLFLK